MQRKQKKLKEGKKKQFSKEHIPYGTKDMTILYKVYKIFTIDLCAPAPKAYISKTFRREDLA